MLPYVVYRVTEPLPFALPGEYVVLMLTHPTSPARVVESDNSVRHLRHGQLDGVISQLGSLEVLDAEPDEYSALAPIASQVPGLQPPAPPPPPAYPRLRLV